jgi:DNA-binding response OmpR family regulator
MDESKMNQTKKKVLFIDDDKFLLDMYSLKFSNSGYEVKTADSTDVAMKMIREGYIPDAMLIDIVMPGMDGLEFVAALRKEKLAESSYIIMLTNQGASDDIARAKRFNVDGYIVKATTIPSEVLAQVEKITSTKKITQ